MTWVLNAPRRAPRRATGCSVGVSISTKRVPVQRLAQRTDDRRAVADHLPAVRVDGQVDVALPDPRLGVGEALVLVGQRPQRLAGQRPRRRQDAELAASAADDLARSRRRGRRGRRRTSSRPAAARPTPSRLIITWTCDSPSLRVAKQSLPPVRLSSTRPATDDGLAGGGVGGEVAEAARGPRRSSRCGGSRGRTASMPAATSRSYFSRRTRTCSGRSLSSAPSSVTGAAYRGNATPFRRRLPRSAPSALPPFLHDQQNLRRSLTGRRHPSGFC